MLGKVEKQEFKIYRFFSDLDGSPRRQLMWPTKNGLGAQRRNTLWQGTVESIRLQWGQQSPL
jgi:hypothetical protein